MLLHNLPFMDIHLNAVFSHATDKKHTQKKQNKKKQSSHLVYKERIQCLEVNDD